MNRYKPNERERAHTPPAHCHKEEKRCEEKHCMTICTRPGPPGPPGRPGCDGRPGPPGPRGPKGEPGKPGCDGRPGPRGEKGEPGCDGKPGCDGRPGCDGKEGPRGPRGIQGERGCDGKPGPKGEPGCDGKDGCPGPRGPKGEPGCDGRPGPKGERGCDGKDGCPGQRGPRGPKGERGEDGAIDTYAYLYTTQCLVECELVDFDCAGALAGAIVPHGRKVVLEESADYAVWFTVDAREADCVELRQNGHKVAGGAYARSGMAIVRAERHDELSVCVTGHCACGAVNCGCEAVKAGLLILKLGAKRMHCTHHDCGEHEYDIYEEEYCTAD